MSKYHSIIEPVKDFVEEVDFRVRRNPVLVGTAAVAAYSSLTAGHLTASAVVSIVVGFLVRSKVVPAADVEAFVSHASGIVNDLHAAVHAAQVAALPPAPAALPTDSVQVTPDPGKADPPSA